MTRGCVLVQLLNSSQVRLLPVAEALATEGGIGVYIEPELASTLSPELNPITGAPPGESVLYGPDGSATAAPTAGTPDAAADNGDGDGDGVSAGLVVGIVFAAVVVCAVIGLVAVVISRRKSRAAQGGPPQHPDYTGPPPYGAPYNGAAYNTGNYFTPGTMPHGSYHDQGSHAPVYGKSGYNVATGAFGDTRAYGALPSLHPVNGPGVVAAPLDADTVWTEDLTMNTLEGRTATSVTSNGSGVRTRRGAASRGVTGDPGSPVGPLPPNASVDDKIERIHKQLDGMHSVGRPVLGRFEILSSHHRRQGGATLAHMHAVHACH